MRGIPTPVLREAQRTGDVPLPGGRHSFGYVVRDIIDKNRREFVVGHKATPKEWESLMRRHEAPRIGSPEYQGIAPSRDQVTAE